MRYPFELLVVEQERSQDQGWSLNAQIVNDLADYYERIEPAACRDRGLRPRFVQRRRSFKIRGSRAATPHLRKAFKFPPDLLEIVRARAALDRRSLVGQLVKDLIDHLQVEDPDRCAGKVF